MNIKYAAMLLNSFAFALTAAEHRQRYIAVHNRDINPFAELPATSIADAQSIMQADDEVWSEASLTANEAAYIRKQLDNQVILSSDDNVYIPNDETSIAGRRADSSTNSDQYMNDIPHCKNEVNGVDIVVLDTVVDKRGKEFDGVKLTIGPSYVNSILPCNGHGTKVTGIIAGKTVGVISKGDFNVYTVGVFDCAGRGTVSILLYGIAEAMSYATQQKELGRRVVVNLSGVSPANYALDRAVEKLIAAGVAFNTAAGNSRTDACSSTSPAQVGNAFTVGSTKYPGNVPAEFTNYGRPCVDVFLAGTEVTVIDFYNGGTTKGDGTSYSTPIATAQHAMEISIDPTATPKQVADRILARTVTVTPPDDALFGQPMQVMLAKDSCPRARYFDKYTSQGNNNSQSKNWLSIIKNEHREFCIKVNIKLQNIRGWASIGFRNSTNNLGITELKLGERLGKKYIHALLVDGKAVASQITPTRLVNIKKASNFEIEAANNTLAISYNNQQQKIKLFETELDSEQTEVAFGAGGRAKVLYTNAAPC